MCTCSRAANSRPVPGMLLDLDRSRSWSIDNRSLSIARKSRFIDSYSRLILTNGLTVTLLFCACYCCRGLAIWYGSREVHFFFYNFRYKQLSIRRLSATVADDRRQSSTVADDRRQSSTVADDRRLSPTVADDRRLSPTVADDRRRSPMRLSRIAWCENRRKWSLKLQVSYTLGRQLCAHGRAG